MKRKEKRVVKDQAGSMEIVLFSSVKDKVSNSRCHAFKKLKIQKFMDIRLLNLTETIIVSQNESVEMSEFAQIKTKCEVGRVWLEQSIKIKYPSTACFDRKNQPGYFKITQKQHCHDLTNRRCCFTHNKAKKC